MSEFNLVEYCLKLTERVESPTSFLEWGIRSCISAVLTNKVYLEKPYRKSRVYPNMYVVLLGDTGVRKSPPIDINLQLLKEGKEATNNTKVMAGSGTMAGIIKTLANQKDGQPIGGSGYLLARELADFFIADESTVKTLTNLYDPTPLYDKHLSGTDLPDIKDLCLSMLGATNERMIEQFLDITAKTGGFLSRCLMIAENERRHVDSGYEEGVYYATDEDWKPVYKHLNELKKAAGPLRLTMDAMRLINDWYHGFDENWRVKETGESIRTGTGYETRLLTHIEKVAIVNRAARPNFSEMLIHEEDVELAVQLCMDLIPTYRRLMHNPKEMESSDIINAIMQRMAVRPPNYFMSRQLILNEFYTQVSGKVLDETMKDLVDGEMLHDDTHNNYVGWCLTNKALGILGIDPTKRKNHKQASNKN